MFCGHCGTEVPDIAEFCPNCGAAMRPSQATVVDAYSPSDESAKAAQKPKRPKKKTGLIIGIVAAVVVVAAIVAGVLLYMHHQDEIAHQEVSLSINLNATGYAAPEKGGVPVKISGTDLDGASVEIYVLLIYTDTVVELHRGDYTIAAAGDAIAADGAFYAAQDNMLSVTIDENGISDADGNADPTLQLGYTEVAAESVTDDQIAGAKQALIDAGVDEEAATAIAATATTKRDTRLAEIQAEQEEAAARAEAEARANSLHISTDLYELDLPDYWYDKIEIEYSGTDVTVYQKGYRTLSLAYITVEDGGPSYWTDGDVSGAALASKESGNRRVVVRAAFFSYYAEEFYNRRSWLPSKLTEAELRSGIDLQSLGTKSYDDYAKASNSDYSGSTIAYDAIKPTIVTKW